MSHKLDVLKQSQVAYKQWAPQWRDHARHHSRYKMKDLIEFQNHGVGRACLVIANGHSFEENIETIKKYQHNVDILAVDKCIAHCIRNGITPKFGLVCDANVSYETYLKPVENQLQDTILLANVCANPKWSDNGNWKDRFYFVNKDVLNSHIEFSGLSGCQNFIPAATNVSNAAIVMLTQCENEGRRNFFGYDKLLLIGYDYCWEKGKYYAFDPDGGGKNNYMRTTPVITVGGDFVYTSPNLLFSAKWMSRYLKVFNIPAIQCTKKTLLPGFKLGDLALQMQYRYKPEDAKEVNRLLEYRRRISAEIEKINATIFNIGRDHFKQLIRTT